MPTPPRNNLRRAYRRDLRRTRRDVENDVQAAAAQAAEEARTLTAPSGTDYRLGVADGGPLTTTELPPAEGSD